MKHIVWDFNGTLLADVQLAVHADNDVFGRLGLPAITIDEYRRRMTMPVRDFYEALGIDFAVHAYEMIGRMWLGVFNARAVEAGLVPGALETVARLAERGYTQSVLSASYEPTLISQCDALGLTPYMRAINGLSDETAGRKSAIGAGQLRTLGVQAQDAVLVGDMLADAELARELGMACVLVPWGHNDLARLLESGCPVAYSFDELERQIAALR